MLIVNRIFITILMLSITGFIFSFIYLICERGIYKFTSSKFMVFINTIAIISFIIPFYFVQSFSDKSEIYFYIYKTIIFENIGAFDIFVANLHKKFDLLIKNLDLFWLLGVFIFLLINIFYYIKLKNKIKKESFEITSRNWIIPFEKIKKEKGIKVSILCSNYVGIPCTFGIFKKYILIPEEMINVFDNEEISFILNHEIYHIENRDSLRKFIILILNSINWFNPLFYFLRNNLSNWIESACDEEVVHNFDYEKKRKYSNLIIKILELESSTEHQNYYIVGFNGNSIKNYKRRILRIMKKNKRDNFLGKILISTVVSLVMCTSSVIAKEMDTAVNKIFSKNIQIENSNNIKLYSGIDERNEYEMDIIKKQFENINFDEDDYVEFSIPKENSVTYRLINKDGIVLTDFNINENVRHSCKYENYLLEEHTKNNNGSCETIQYKAKRCTVCNRLKLGSYINTIRQDICTH